MTGDLAQRRCPHCAEDIRAEAMVCRHCGRRVQERPLSKEAVGLILALILAVGAVGTYAYQRVGNARCDEAREQGGLLMANDLQREATPEDYVRRAQDLRASAAEIERVC